MKTRNINKNSPNAPVREEAIVGGRMNKIYINGNKDFKRQASANGWSGDGTYENPYIIEGYNIDANCGSYCIMIENTDVWFVIQRCSLKNANNDAYTGAGIILRNVSNAKILHNKIDYCSNGVYVSDGNNIEIGVNKCSFNDKDGVYIENSRKVIVTGNICIGNDNGIFVSACDNSDVYANITNDNFGKGILVQFCDYCFVSQNKSVANFENGLCVSNSKRITIHKNLCVCHAVYDALFCNIKQCRLEKNEFEKVKNIE